jgi:hypothetical protein
MSPNCQGAFSNTIASKYLAICYIQIAITHLAIKERQIASNYLAKENAKWIVIIYQCWWHHADIIKPNEGIHVLYSTPPTKDLILSKTMAVIAMMRG